MLPPTFTGSFDIRWRRHSDGYPHFRKCGVRFKNRVSISSTSWDKSTSGLQATFLDIWLPLTSESIGSSSIEMLNAENVELAVGNSLPSCILDDIREITLFPAAILDFWLPVSSDKVADRPNEKFDPKNMGVAVGILLLASLEAEISLGGSFTPPLQHKR